MPMYLEWHYKHINDTISVYIMIAWYISFDYDVAKDKAWDKKSILYVYSKIVLMYSV